MVNGTYRGETMNETEKTADKSTDMDLWDIGDRHLNNDDIEHLRLILNDVFGYFTADYPPMSKINRKLAQMLREENINYESALNLYTQLKGDVNALKKVYSAEKIPKSRLTLSELLVNDFTVDKSKRIQNEVMETIKKPRFEGCIRGELGSDSIVVIDPSFKQIKHVNVNIKNGKDYSKESLIVDAYPKQVTVYESPLVEEPRRWEVLWDSSVRKTPFKRGPWLVEDIINDLAESGYITGHRYVKDVVPFVLNTYIREGLAKIKTEIDTPGFFWDEKESALLNVKYEVDSPDTKELRTALNILEDFSTYFEGHTAKLATVFKWGLISPFIFAKKQQGEWVPWLYLYGKAQSGKTTLGEMVQYMWTEPSNENNMGGGDFDSVAKVGRNLSKFTFPIVVNEPAGAFKRVSIQEIIKTAIERTTSRGRHEGRAYRMISAFGPVIFTANHFIPDDDALLRRLIILNFTHSEKKEENEKKEFKEKFQMENPKKCLLNAFKAITQEASQELISEPSLLELNWKELADTLILRIYSAIGQNPPKWIMQWSKSETMDDLDEEHREDIRIFLLNQINKAQGRVQLVDEEYRPINTLDESSNVKDPDHFKSKVWRVLNERLIAWMIPHNQNNIDYVCLTVGFKKEVQQELKICQPLKGIAELMGWEYKAVRIPEPTKVIKISFKKFVEFLYPMGRA